MEKIAVFVNDADHARVALAPLLQADAARHWILVACAPTLTRHIGRWVSGAAREQWRERWATTLYADVEPMLRAHPGNRVDKMLARRPLIDVAKRLDQRLGDVKVFDARRPRVGAPADPLQASASGDTIGRWTYPVAITTGLSAMLALAD